MQFACDTALCNIRASLWYKAIKLITLHDSQVSEVRIIELFPDFIFELSQCSKFTFYFLEQMFKGVCCKFLMAYVSLYMFSLLQTNLYGGRYILCVCPSIRQNNDVLLSICGLHLYKFQIITLETNQP